MVDGQTANQVANPLKKRNNKKKITSSGTAELQS
jgi:hypothetical protein